MIYYDELCKILNQKTPFIFIDRVLDYKKNSWIQAIKCISGNELFSAMHFPYKAVYPGLFLIESAAQSASVLFSLSNPEIKTLDIPVLGGIRDFQFYHKILPGDTITINVELIKAIENMAITKITINCGENIAAKGKLTFGVMKHEEP